jgi:hypothetical protein
MCRWRTEIGRRDELVCQACGVEIVHVGKDHRGQAFVEVADHPAAESLPHAVVLGHAAAVGVT